MKTFQLVGLFIMFVVLAYVFITGLLKAGMWTSSEHEAVVMGIILSGFITNWIAYYLSTKE